MTRRWTTSKPKAERFFAYDANELAVLVRDLGFSTFWSDKRLDILLENCMVECPAGHQLCSFLRRSYVAGLSLPTRIASGMARRATGAALARLREIDGGPWLAVRDQQFVVYRAYLADFGRLSVAQHVVSAGHRSYLRFRAASQLSKAHRNPDAQTILFKVEIV